MTEFALEALSDAEHRAQLKQLLKVAEQQLVEARFNAVLNRGGDGERTWTEKVANLEHAIRRARAEYAELLVQPESKP